LGSVKIETCGHDWLIAVAKSLRLCCKIYSYNGLLRCFPLVFSAPAAMLSAAAMFAGAGSAIYIDRWR